jgi:hypothetical protein
MTDQLPTLLFDIDKLENGEPKKTERIKDGLSYYRILPAYGTNHGGALSKKYFLHWGFTGANGKPRSISCSYLTEGYCPICAVVFEKQKEFERAKANGNEELQKQLEEYISKHKVRKVWLYNAVTMDGRIVILELGKTAHDDLTARISEAVRLKVCAFDPTSPSSGVWFEFNRVGKGFGTKYTVDFKKTSVTLEDGSVAEKKDRSPLPSDLVAEIEQALKGTTGIMHDIHVAHETTTSSQLRELMNNGGVITPRKREEPATVQNPAGLSTSTPISSGAIAAEIERLRKEAGNQAGA